MFTENDTDQIYSIGAGGFVLKKDVDTLNDYFKAQKPLSKLMKDYEFAFDAIYYEMCNHEYGINWQRNWDVCNCFSDEELEYHGDDMSSNEELEFYFKAMKWNKTQKKAFYDAKEKYWNDALENQWF